MSRAGTSGAPGARGASGAAARHQAGPRRADSRQLSRQWALLRLLATSGRSWSVRALAEQLETSKTTIDRDLKTLESHFALVVEEQGKQKKTYRLDDSLRALESITFGTTELLAVCAALSAVPGVGGTVLDDDVRHVIDKIRGFLAPRHNGGLDRMRRVFLSHPRGYIDYEPHSETIDNLNDAIARRRVCSLDYRAAWTGGTPRRHDVKPLHLLWHNRALYLLAQICGRDDVTKFAVHRIQDVDVDATNAFDPARIDIDAAVRTAFGIFTNDDERDVEVVFHSDIAWRIQERIYHPDEEKTLLDDGRLRYRIRTSAKWEIIPWVRSFGPLAELVTPKDWRTEIADTLAAAAALYE